MDSQHKVLFYGNSLVLAGVQATFRADPGFETIALDRPATQTELLVLNPRVIVFDLGALESEFLLAQLPELPGLLRHGVAPRSHDVLFTVQVACSISLDQLSHIVRHLIGPRVGQIVSPASKATSSV